MGDIGAGGPGSSLVDHIKGKLKPDQIEGLRKEAIHRIRVRGGDVPDAPAEDRSPAPVAAVTPDAPVPGSRPSGESNESPSAALPAEVQRATRVGADGLGKIVRIQGVGRGHSSSVMKAWDSQDGRSVALHII